jgi:hypothetical protein
VTGTPAAVSVPAALVFDPSLSDGALRAYAQLAGHAQQTGSRTLELSGDQLGAVLGVSPGRAARRVRELEGRGLLAVRRRIGGDQASWYLVRDPGMPAPFGE